jgi:hypothetical protein
MGERRCCCWLGLPVASRTSHAVVGSEHLVRSRWRCCLYLGSGGGCRCKAEEADDLATWSLTSSRETPSSLKMPLHKVLLPPDCLCSGYVSLHWSSCKSTLIYSRPLRHKSSWIWRGLFQLDFLCSIRQRYLRGSKLIEHNMSQGTRFLLH